MGMNIMTAYVGPMMSSKTASLVSHCHESILGNRPVLAFRPSKDTRATEPVIQSRNSNIQIPCHRVEDSAELWQIFFATGNDCSVVAIDEVQLFNGELANYVRMIRRTHEVVVAGLDLDYRGEPFGQMPELLVLADRVVKLTAVCNKCGERTARYTQRLRDGLPDSAFAESIVIEGRGNLVYQARCHRCFEEPPDIDSWRAQHCSRFC